MKGARADKTGMQHPDDTLGAPDRFEPIGGVLIVEDDAMIAMAIESIVRELGALSVQIVATPTEAIAAAGHGSFGCAILEAHSGLGSTEPVADILAERNIPFLFCTSLLRDDISERHRDRPLLPKPFSDIDLKGWLLRLAASTAALPAAVPQHA